MTTTHLNLTRITLNSQELIKHVSNVYADIIMDSKDDHYAMQGMCDDYNRIIKSIEEGSLKSELEQGFTMTVLPDRVFCIIENYFKNRKYNVKTELQVVIIDEKLNVVETIHEDYLNY